MDRIYRKIFPTKSKGKEPKPKIAFLHIPKTGGTYILQREDEGGSPVIENFVNLGHCYISATSEPARNPIYAYHDSSREFKVIQYLEKIKEYAVFANARNPFSFLVSYLYHAGYGDTNYQDKDHYDYKIAQKGFDYLLKTLANREDIWPNRKFLFLQMFASNGDFVVDWINRQESLDNDLKLLADKFDVRYRRKQKQRIGGHKDYRSYYNDSLIDIVYSTWGRELRLFGYDFDGVQAEFPVMHLGISPEQKYALKYFWQIDKMIVDGHEINSSKYEPVPIMRTA